MPDERDQEITSRKVTSNSNTPLNRYNVSEERTTKVKDDSSSNAVIVIVLLFLAVGAGAVAYYLNNRPVTPILVPSAVDTVRENKSTVIERNNTTIKEVSPATSQPTPKVDITVQPQPVAPAETPKAATPAATPRPTTGSPNN
ncbi:hypothetical protein [Pseudanabaena sp. lw0831]|uniref:hypothetical protein n=1 Tax=Pseudanabaena sp. lw0831 TaxID=1357935 RepID=UPI001915F846|nr:hypothetical protein [Pseudanabaena sp. lw0831]